MPKRILTLGNCQHNKDESQRELHDDYLKKAYLFMKKKKHGFLLWICKLSMQCMLIMGFNETAQSSQSHSLLN